MLNIRLVADGVPHSLGFPSSPMSVMTRSAGPPFRPVTAEKLCVTLTTSRLEPLSAMQLLLATPFPTLVARVAPTTALVLRRRRRLTHIAPMEPVAVPHRPTQLQSVLFEPDTGRPSLGKSCGEPLPNIALRSMFARMAESSANGPTAELILQAVLAMPPSRPPRQLLFVHSETTELLPMPIDRLLARMLLGTFVPFPAGSVARHTRLRPDPLTAAMTAQLLALRLLRANVPEPTSLSWITRSRHLPGFLQTPRRVPAMAPGTAVLSVRPVATQLLLPTTPTMCLNCDPVRPVPMVGL